MDFPFSLTHEDFIKQCKLNASEQQKKNFIFVAVDAKV